MHLSFLSYAQHIIFINERLLHSLQDKVLFPEMRNRFDSLMGSASIASPESLSMVRSDVDAPLCKNASNHNACNGTALPGSSFCLACHANETIPDLSAFAYLGRWRAMEKAKRRLFYSLHELGLIEVSAHPLPNSAPPLSLKFLEGTADEPVTTGHVDGLVTIDIAEAKDSERERRRNALGEDYRTPLGHLCHETGHYFWILPVDNV